MITRIRAGACVVALLAVFVACSSETIEYATNSSPDPTSSGFVDGDASTGADVTVFTAYCPSNKCPLDLTTCPTSQYPCDVNLKSDLGNCGACGAACPAPTDRESYQCVNGECVLM